MSHFSRRHFVKQQAFGIGGVALSWLFNHDALRASPPKPLLDRPTFDLKPRSPLHPPQARAMISMFMQGGPSHIDLFDPKPELNKRHLQNFTGDIKYDNAAEASTKLFGSPWKFTKHGQCGMELSELLPHLGRVADDICLIRSMHTGVNNHGQSINALNTGQIAAGRPALGSWLTYALGSESQDLPAFVVLSDPGGLPVLGVENWQNGWLPSLYQGTVVRPQEPRILNLDPTPQLRGPAQRQLSELSRQAQPRALGSASARTRPGGTDSKLRTGRPNAVGRQRGAGHFGRNRGHAQAVRHRPTRHARLWHTLSDRPSTGRARRAVRAAPYRQSNLGSSR